MALLSQQGQANYPLDTHLLLKTEYSQSVWQNESPQHTTTKPLVQQPFYMRKINIKKGEGF